MRTGTLAAECAIGGLILLACGTRGCAPTPTVQGSLFAGLEDLLEAAEPISTFDGEWLSTEFTYAFRITNRVGVATLSNSTLYDIGDAIVVIASVDGTRFNGRHIFTDGTVREVVGSLTALDTLQLAGGGFVWTLSRFDAVNAPPSVDAAGNASITLPTDFVDLDGTVSDDGLPTGSLTTTWSKVSGPDGVTFADPHAVDTTVTFAQAGTYLIQLEATDGELTATDSLTIFVRAQVNEPPSVDAGSNRSITLPTNFVDLDGRVDDDGLPGGPLTTIWTKVDGPGGVAFSEPDEVDTTVTFAQPGTYRIQLQASDGELSAADVITIFVRSEPPESP